MEKHIYKGNFDFIREFVRNEIGMVLEKEKEYLIEYSLKPVYEAEGLKSIGSLVAHLRTSRPGKIHERILDAITINETSFFRDGKPFDALENTLIPKLVSSGALSDGLNIWCAACSSGQEPYSIAMLIKDCFPHLGGAPVKIIGTDVSGSMLERARVGQFNDHEIGRGLPEQMRNRYFRKNATHWQANDELRSMVEFQKINLINSWPVLPGMHIVFLRNVLIYFSTEHKMQILRKVRKVLHPDGFLVLGACDLVPDMQSLFIRERIDDGSVFYRSGADPETKIFGLPNRTPPSV